MPQIPSAELAQALGVVPYLLIVLILFGVGLVTWFTKRAAAALDRMAASLETVRSIDERIGHLEQKVETALRLSDEALDIARMWRSTEGPGRTIKREKQQGP